MVCKYGRVVCHVNSIHIYKYFPKYKSASGQYIALTHRSSSFIYVHIFVISILGLRFVNRIQFQFQFQFRLSSLVRLNFGVLMLFGGLHCVKRLRWINQVNQKIHDNYLPIRKTRHDTHCEWVSVCCRSPIYFVCKNDQHTKFLYRVVNVCVRVCVCFSFHSFSRSGSFVVRFFSFDSSAISFFVGRNR